ncbi:hypothetical protein OsI_19929 [Oryza sativa Indica Group]|nr:hypothetical protein OsI_19929 [Oryza sativa Indica Group]
MTPLRRAATAVLVVVLAVVVAAAAAAKPRRILVDTDMDTDDLFALLYLLKQNRSEFELKRQGRRGAAAAAAEGVDDGKVDILSFDVANAMSRAANLYPLAVGHRGGAAAHLLCLGSQAVRALVPGDDSWLLALTLAEKLDALNRVAEVATRLGRRCMLQALLGFDHVYADLLAGCSDAVAISSR